MNEAAAVVLFDGQCCFCQSSVQFIIKRDPQARFRFAPLQSDVGKSLAATHGIDAEQLDGLILIEDRNAYQKSAAALRIARRLKWPWPIFSVLRVVPRIVSDWFYDQFAKRRYRWYGRTETCPLPGPEESKRFLNRVDEMNATQLLSEGQ
jgi:predicted DCC family thiol-disulfide oxidoreductase YuxK